MINREQMQNLVDTEGGYVVVALPEGNGFCVPVKDIVVYDDGFWFMLYGDHDGRGIHTVRGDVEWSQAQMQVVNATGTFQLFSLSYGLEGDRDAIQAARDLWRLWESNETKEYREWRLWQKKHALEAPLRLTT